MKRAKRHGAASKQNRRGKAVRGGAGIQGPLGQILRHAIQVEASDVHLELGGDRCRARYRVHGSLQEGGPKLTRAAAAAAIGMAKRLADLKPERSGVPRSGRIEWEPGERDFLVSVAPCVGGESVVFRHLLRAGLFRNLDQLGLEESIVTTLRRWTARRNGLVIVSGLTGSGKATMFYALLQELNTPAVKIVAIEEPVYYRIEGINHIEVDSKQGPDYATALRCALAQDADLIAIGEVKNAESAEVAFKAAFSGHQVLTVMHAEDGPETVERLRDVGIEPKLITRGLVGVLSMRLVRKICDPCKVARQPTAAERATLLKGRAGGRFYRGKGCARCGGTGYRGRAAVFELFELDDKFKALILRGASVDALRRQARKSGIASLRDAALAKAKAGITTLSEALR